MTYTGFNPVTVTVLYTILVCSILPHTGHPPTAQHITQSTGGLYILVIKPIVYIFLISLPKPGRYKSSDNVSLLIQHLQRARTPLIKYPNCVNIIRLVGLCCEPLRYRGMSDAIIWHLIWPLIIINQTPPPPVSTLYVIICCYVMK